MILYLAADLIWATRIKGTAEGLGVACRPARSVKMLEERLGEGPVAAVLLDLDKSKEALEMIERLRGPSAADKDLGVRVLCWGPHVATGLFEAARRAGADEVLTRGVFDRDLPDILLRLASGSGGGGVA